MKIYYRLAFVTDQGKISKITINNARTNLLNNNIIQGMEEIITGNAFKTKNGKFASRESAKLYTVVTTNYDVTS